MTFTYFKHTLVLLLVLVISACGKQSTSSSPEINGTATKGVIANAPVRAYLVDTNSNTQTNLAETRTDQSGNFSLILPDDSQTNTNAIILIELTSDSQSTMRCDLVSGCTNQRSGQTFTFGSNMPLSNDFVMYGLIHQDQSHLSPLSHIVVTTARLLPEGLTLENISTAKRWVNQAFDLAHNVISTPTPDLTSLGNSNLALEELIQGLWSASFFDLSQSPEWSTTDLDSLPLADLYDIFAEQSELLAETLESQNNSQYSSSLSSLATEASNKSTALRTEELTIQTNPSSQTINEGEDTVLRVSATGPNSISYQWQKDGVIIPGATESYYAIENATLDDQGIYNVVASDGNEELASLYALVTVNEVITPVSIVTQPASQTVSEGDPILLSVGVAGDGPFTYQWQKGGSLIPGANAQSYTISASELSDTGSYRVLVSNTVNDVASDFADITVIQTISEVTITEHPQSKMITEGLSVTFSVTATGGGLINYQWQKDGSNISGAFDSSFTISGITASDAGSYQVIVSNSQGNVTSSPANLTVIPSAIPLTIQQHPISKSVYAGDFASFAVLASGDGSLSYQWLHNGSPISGATTSSYVIPSSNSVNIGTYSVIVSDNNASETSMVALLEVEELPSIQVSWFAPTEREDGEALSDESISGYRIEYGPSLEQMTESARITDGLTTQYLIPNVSRGTLVVRVATEDSEGTQGEFSAPFSIDVNY